MKTITRIFLSAIIVAIGFSSIGWSANFEFNKEYDDYFKLSRGRSLYIRWNPPMGQKEVLVLINGLTYSTNQWERITAALMKNGYGVLRFDMKGMGETLRRDGMPKAEISYRTQVDDLNELATLMGLPQKLNLVGLSYGGGIALAFGGIYPERVKNLFLMAPFTEALQSQDQLIKMQIAATRVQFPFNPATDDELYDYFLKQLVYTTYPSTEPIVLEQPYKLEATFRMVQGIRRWKASSISQLLPAKSVHYMIAGSDQYIPRTVLEDFWKTVPDNSKASKIVILQSEHKIPEAVPNYAAHWIHAVLSQSIPIDPLKEYIGVPFTGSVMLGKETWDIGSEFIR